MKVSAIITAAGIGKRMGGNTPKQFLKTGEMPILVHTLRRFEQSKLIENIVVTTESSWLDKTIDLLKNANITKEWSVIEGGAKRQDSVRNGINALPKDTETVVVHDGVRPFIETNLIDQSIEIAKVDGGCIIAVPIQDTIKRIAENHIKETVSRTDLWSAQTPQTFRYEILKEAFDKAYQTNHYGTDEASLVERIGYSVRIIHGGFKNIKITTPEDLEIAEAIAKRGKYMRTGIGYDMHKLTDGRKLIVGGIDIPHEKGLLGHSDADVLLHAITDAILGAAALGDIGRHFPDTDPAYNNADSRKLLRNVVKLIREKGHEIGNVDAVIIAEKPKMAVYIPSMRKNIAEDMEIDIDFVSIKATTNEGIGFIGRGEGIAAQAIVTIKREKP